MLQIPSCYPNPACIDLLNGSSSLCFNKAKASIETLIHHVLARVVGIPLLDFLLLEAAIAGQQLDQCDTDLSASLSLVHYWSDPAVIKVLAAHQYRWDIVVCMDVLKVSVCKQSQVVSICSWLEVAILMQTPSHLVTFHTQLMLWNVQATAASQLQVPTNAPSSCPSEAIFLFAFGPASPNHVSVVWLHRTKGVFTGISIPPTLFSFGQ